MLWKGPENWNLGNGIVHHDSTCPLCSRHEFMPENKMPFQPRCTHDMLCCCMITFHVPNLTWCYKGSIMIVLSWFKQNYRIHLLWVMVWSLGWLCKVTTSRPWRDSIDWEVSGVMEIVWSHHTKAVGIRNHT